MRLFQLFSIPFILLVSQNLSAQSSLPTFGAYSSEELNMKECSFDKEADAVVLLDEAFSNYDDDYQLITTRRVRIKILNDKGIDKGNVTIRFYSEDQFEAIRNIEALTYTKDQSSPVSKLDRKSIFIEKVNEHFSKIKFAMPNVKAGSIIEYKYESVMKNYGGLQKWIFQSDIPTIKSCYLLAMVPSAEFSYSVSKKSNYKIIITPKADVGQIYFEMNNIPGLQFEPYMDAPKDYLQQVEFQLAGFVNRIGNKQTVNKSWRDIALDLSTDKYLGNAVKKDLPKIDEIKTLLEKETTLTGRINAIYNYVKSYFTWEGNDGIYAFDGLKKVWEKRSGSTGEINLVLISLLRAFDIDASPLLVAERDYGKVDPRLPFLDRFNKTVAYVNAEGKNLILDATQKFCPAEVTPYPLLNTYGLVIDKKTTDVINLKPANEAFFTSIIIYDTLDKTGLLKGRSLVKSDQYAKQLQAEQITKNEKNFIKKYEEKNPGVSIDSFAFENLNNDIDPLIQHIRFNEQFDKTGDFVLLNSNLFSGLVKNPFTKDERFTNVDFGFPYHITVDETIELPDNSKIEGIPADKKLVTPDKDISIARQIKQTGNTLHVQIDFGQTVTLVSYDDYEGLKNFYRQMISMLNEPITVKLTK